MKNGNILHIIFQPDIFILKINNNNNIDIIDTINNHNGKNLIHIFELKNENLVSADINSYEIKLWKKNNNIYWENKVIKENNILQDVFEIKNNIIAYDVCRNNKMVLYDLNERKKINTFNKIEVNNNWASYKRFCLINDNIL